MKNKAIPYLIAFILGIILSSLGYNYTTIVFYIVMIPVGLVTAIVLEKIQNR